MAERKYNKLTGVWETVPTATERAATVTALVLKKPIKSPTQIKEEARQETLQRTRQGIIDIPEKVAKTFLAKKSPLYNYLTGEQAGAA